MPDNRGTSVWKYVGHTCSHGQALCHRPNPHSHGGMVNRNLHWYDY